MILEGFFKADFYEAEILIHVHFLRNMKIVSKIDLNKHFKALKQNQTINVIRLN